MRMDDDDDDVGRTNEEKWMKRDVTYTEIYIETNQKGTTGL